MRIIIFLTLLGICFNGFSQTNSKADTIKQFSNVVPKTSKHYLRFSLGYRFFAGTGGIYNINQGVGTNKVRIEKVSSGMGVPISVAFGNYLTKGMAFEFDFTYKPGRTKSIINTLYDEMDFSTIEQSQVFTFNEIQFSPRLVNEIKIKKTFIQFKLGTIISLGKERLEIKELFTDQFGNTANGQFEWDTKIKPGVGFLGALGLRGQIDDGVSVFADLTFIELSRWWDGSRMTMAVIENQDVLPDMSESQKVQIPVSELDASVDQDSDKPKQVLQTKRNYSSIGFNIGIIRHF